MNGQAIHSYATAFYEMFQESGKANTFAEEADNLAQAISDPEIVAFFKSPIYSAQDKENLVAQALGGKLDGLLADFVKLLAKNGRLHLFPQILQEFKDTAGGKGLKKGTVYSAADLSDAEKKSIQSSIEKKLGIQVSLDFKIKPELIGGVEAHVGSYIIEDSLKSNLEKLNDSLKRSSH